MSYVGSVFFFFKQKTAYELRISDWSSDVCSSDLRVTPPERLNFDHDVDAFRNGRHASLDLWLNERALASEGASARTYVVCGADRPSQVVRSEERRVGKECVSNCRSRWSQ